VVRDPLFLLVDVVRPLVHFGLHLGLDGHGPAKERTL
jgi:hypothetical protein